MKAGLFQVGLFLSYEKRIWIVQFCVHPRGVTSEPK